MNGDPAHDEGMDRRSFLRASGAAAAVGAAASLIPGSPASADRKPPRDPLLTASVLRAFDSDVTRACRAFDMVGASVALFEGNKTVYNRGFGVRDLRSRQPVTTHTRFRIASNTKSMTSLLLARYVDDGLVRWNTRAADLWPGFRAPNARLTSSLRLADLLGMGTGIAEPATAEFFISAGEDSALDVLQSIPYLPVLAAPGTEYHYNNTLVSAAPFLVLLDQGVKPADLMERYAAEVQRVIFRPIGMRDSGVGSDPRPVTSDFATGYHVDLSGAFRRTPFISIDGQGPSGSAMSSSTDMARYLITHMQLGVNPNGQRIASERNVRRTHRPGINVPLNATNEDTSAMRYCLCWFDQRFTDGRHLLWHAGGIDGFGSLMGFFPRERIGFAILTNLEPSASNLFNLQVQSRLLTRLFGFYEGIPALLSSAAATVAQQKAQLAARTRPVDRAAIQPYLGLYSDGFELRLDAEGRLRLRHDIRSMPVSALDDGGYVITDGPGIVAMKTLTLATSGGNRTLTIQGFDPVRWLTGD